MAEVMAKKPLHPAFPRMVCDAMHAHPEPMSMQSLKKWLPEHYKLANGWEKHLNKVVKMMLAKKQLVHAHGHMGSFRLSKAMAAKEEKRLGRKPRVMKVHTMTTQAHRHYHVEKKAAPLKKNASAPKKRKAPAKKIEGPAKRAKKAAPKK
jgi:hypothetical protein